MIWSCCTLGYKHELDLLEIRLREQDSVVDVFVISEAAWTYSGKEKPFHLNPAAVRWAPWRDKLRVVRVDDEPNWSLFPHQSFGVREHWQRENHQRRALGRVMGDVHPHDVVHVSDLDEILKAEALLKYDEDDEYLVVHPQLPMHRHFLNLHWRDRVALSIGRICRGHLLREVNFDAELVRQSEPRVEWLAPYWNAYALPDFDLALWGWHFSWMGGPAAIAQKLRVAAHPEELMKGRNDTPRAVRRLLDTGRDLQGQHRPLFWLPDDRLPAAALDDRFAHLRCGPERATPNGDPARAAKPDYYWRG